MRWMMKNKKFKMCLCLFIILISVLSVMILTKHFRKNYITKDIFDNISYIFEYKDFVREKEGEYKEKIVYAENGDEMWLVYCDDIKVIYWYDMETGKIKDFMYAHVDDSKYVFGEKGLRVGMSKKEVEKILADSQIATPNPHEERIFDNEGTRYYQMGTGYYDDDYWNGMGILYDEEDNVEKIVIHRGL